jgi:EAL and modified HD-GYP domain-containing signal transduction protein
MPPLADQPVRNEVCVARQPIFDDRLRVLGYELLVGADGQETDADRWTSAIFVDAFAEIGLEALTLGHQAWLPVSPEVLIEAALPPVRSDRALFQVRLDVPPDSRLLGAVRRMAGRGSAPALDALPSVAGPALPHASAVKIPVAGMDERALRAELALVAGSPAMLVATGVRTHAMLSTCRSLGFDAFQGPFLAQPDLVPGRGAPTHRLEALTAMARLTGGELGFEEIEELIVRDIGLSHKLLRYANSALFNTRQRVGSVREAMTLLGSRPVQRWASVLALSGVRDQPHELIVTAMIRGRMCELLSAGGRHADRAFTIGLFSVVNALLGAPMREALHGLPLSDEVKEAILHGAGPDGEVLRAVVAWESGDFSPPGGDLTRTALAAAYRDAVRWADEISTPAG